MESLEDQIINKYLENEKLPLILYHYTSIDGLIGIIRDRKFWASDIQYLNDKDEFKRTIELLQLRTRELFKDLKGTNRDWKRTTEKLYAPSDILEKYDIFVTSFTAEGDLLSQWRGYCSSYGFSLGCQLLELREQPKTNLNNFILLPCFYDSKDHKYFIEKVIQTLSEALLTYFKKDPDLNNQNLVAEFHQIYEEYKQQVIIIASILKSSSFSEEKEWRLFCVRKRKQNTEDIKFRNGNSMIIPYIEYEFKMDNSLLPIAEIIVGPTPHPDLSKKSIERLLTSYKYGYGLQDQVKNSKIPFRNW
jgi:hypothetical protein